jgi:hypothetical protein
LVLGRTRERREQKRPPVLLSRIWHLLSGNILPQRRDLPRLASGRCLIQAGKDPLVIRRMRSRNALAMPTSFQGCGTKYYGKRDFHLDMSFVTTEWIVVFLIPIAPLRSVRVLDLDQTSSSAIYPVFSSSRSYEVYSVTNPNLRQALSVYGFMALVVAWPYSVITVSTLPLMGKLFGAMQKSGGGWMVLICILVCLLPWALPIFLRRIAWRKVLQAEVDRSNRETG